MSKLNHNDTSNNQIPMIQTGQALQSLRDSGHSLPTALGEVIDNSIEAKSNNIQIKLFESKNEKGKKHVHQIAISDDGIGMDTNVLHHYLVLGYSTRYMSTNTIGKYGVGAKLAALNFAKRVDVWSRTDQNNPWLHTYFDLNEAIQEEKSGNTVGIAPPVEFEVPDDVKTLLPEKTGTLVVWSNVDRLEHGRMSKDFNSLRLELEKELSRIFRSFIDAGIKISLNETNLFAHDPLMIMENSWTDFILKKHYTSLSKGDPEQKINIKDHYSAELIAEDPIKIGDSKAVLKITLYPKEVRRKRGAGGDKLAKELRVPDNLGSISFVRLNREVSYTNVPKILPSGVTPPDRFIGIEISFNPDLDDFFGIRNVKRGVEPHGELRDRIRSLLKKYIPQVRKSIDSHWREVAKQDRVHAGEHGVVTKAASEADAVMPKGRSNDNKTDKEKEEALKILASDVGYDKDEDQKQYLDRIKDLPFVVESVDFPGNMFITTQHIGGKVLIRLNTRHPFYKDMWAPIKEISERDPGTVSGDEAVKIARRTIEALSLLIIAYGKAESMAPNPEEQFQDLSMYWGQFLSTLMNKVKDVI